MVFQFDNESLVVTKDTYMNDRVYLGLECRESGEMYADITVNIPMYPCGEKQAYIDTNNLPTDLYQTLIENKVISKEVFNVAQSGFCQYPLHNILIDLD